MIYIRIRCIIWVITLVGRLDEIPSYYLEPSYRVVRVNIPHYFGPYCKVTKYSDGVFSIAVLGPVCTMDHEVGPGLCKVVDCLLKSS